MPLLKRINPFLRTNEDTGFSSAATSSHGHRFINRDGSLNLRREGRPILSRISVYHALLNLSVPGFALFIVLFFISINLLFTGIYMWLGPHQFVGMIGTGTVQQFKELYFFSTETFTTVGYGRVNPVGDGANLVASFEAMTGFLSFAVATGLIYGRFSKPKAHLIFSDDALIAPYKDRSALMFRFASCKDYHTLTNVEVQVNIALLVQENGNAVYKYYDLPLERKRIDSLAISWTVVHPIDENSPLQGVSEEDLANADAEVYVMVRGFNDVYSNSVQQRTSYTFREVKYRRKFVPMFREMGEITVVELHKLSHSVAVDDK